MEMKLFTSQTSVIIFKLSLIEHNYTIKRMEPPARSRRAHLPCNGTDSGSTSGLTNHTCNVVCLRNIILL
jgi:hypothetical protein